MQQDLIVTLIQSELYWHNVDANLGMFEEKIWTIGEKTNLILLPEMFTTGFTMDASQFAEPMNGKTFRWMKQQSAQTDAVIMGSYIIYEKGAYYNRLIWMEPDGNYSYYDKRHLFRMGGERERYSPGNQRLIHRINGWNICPMICYDLRFPAWSRNIWIPEQESLAYDVLIYIANWPEKRINAWDILLQARAVENQSYLVGLNRIGQDGNEVKYNGHSAVINPKGWKALSLDDKEAIRTISLEMGKLQEFRKKFPAYLDADSFNILS